MRKQRLRVAIVLILVVAALATIALVPATRRDAVLPAPALPIPTPPDRNAAQPIAGEPCPEWVHAAYTTVGSDGKAYSTWHPPDDPTFGCTFGHEHGADPRTARADNALPAFGYVGALAGDAEPHEGFKVFVVNQGDRSDEGRVATFSFRLVFHMGTSGPNRYRTRFHSMEFDYLGEQGAMHLAGMADTGEAVGATCDQPRQGGRDFSTIGCGDPYEIWTWRFILAYPDEYSGVTEARTAVLGAVAAFDPVTTRNPQNDRQVIYTVTYREPELRIDPLSASSRYRGCDREAYGGPVYWNNRDQPAVYYSDPYGKIVAGPGARILRQETLALAGEVTAFKYRQEFCSPGIHAPN